MKLRIILSLLFISMIISISYNFAYTMVEDKINVNLEAKAELNSKMHRLWEDHITWTRNVILNIIDDLPGKDAAIERLLLNQNEIGNAVKTFYGEKVGDKLTSLLRKHIHLIIEMLRTIKINDQTNFNYVNAKCEKNSDEIAILLFKINPNWKLGIMKKMMRDHIAQIVNVANARKLKNYANDIAIYDLVRYETLQISDTLAAGITKQFSPKLPNFDVKKNNRKQFKSNLTN